MNILIPAAGKGSRFKDAGYTTDKLAIPTTDRFTGEKLPMVVAAVNDLPGAEKPETRKIFVVRPEHMDNGVVASIAAHYPGAVFLPDHHPKGQAATCLVARKLIDNDTPLMTGACDNGMVYDRATFDVLATQYDALVATFRHNPLVLAKPSAHGWVVVGEDGVTATRLSVKKAISDTPMQDHAVVAAFWFKRGSDFVRCVDRMMENNDLINGEFYTDQAMQHAIELGLKVGVWEIDKYVGWGTPVDYEDYEKTIAYWRGFAEEEGKRFG